MIQTIADTGKFGWLTSGNNPHYHLRFSASVRPRHNLGGKELQLEARATEAIKTNVGVGIEGLLNTTKYSVKEFDKLALYFSPKIQGEDQDSQSIHDARLGIGYINMLWWAKIEVLLGPPGLSQYFSLLLTRVFLRRTNELIESGLSPVRNGQDDMTEARHGITLWYLYISQTHKALERSGHCGMFVRIIP